MRGEKPSRSLVMMPPSLPKFTLALLEATHTSRSDLLMANTSSRATSCKNASSELNPRKSHCCFHILFEQSPNVSPKHSSMGIILVCSVCIILSCLRKERNNSHGINEIRQYERTDETFMEPHQFLGQCLSIGVVDFMQLQKVGSWLSSLHVYVVDGDRHVFCLIHCLGLIEGDREELCLLHSGMQLCDEDLHMPVQLQQPSLLEVFAQLDCSNYNTCMDMISACKTPYCQ